MVNVNGGACSIVALVTWQGAHCAGAKFDFIGYVRESMEDDYGKLVGLGLPMWLFLIFFVLLSSVWGVSASLALNSPPQQPCQLLLATGASMIVNLTPRAEILRTALLSECRRLILLLHIGAFQLVLHFALGHTAQPLNI